MSSDYVEPEWASRPRKDMELEVLKSGTVVDKLALHEKSYYTLGRQAGAVDIQLDHPSISRQHAVLQYGHAEGSLHVVDRGSTHGTFVNKQRLEPKKYVKLNVGDVIKFGESTRLYVLCGPAELMPPEYDSENLQKYRLKKLVNSKLAEAGVKVGKDEADAQQDTGASWGFDEDAVESDSGEGSDSEEDEEQLPEYLKTEAQKARRKELKVGLKEEDVNAKDQKAFQNLQKKLQKIENLHTENERITAKEGSQSGLTPGQQAQVDRNMQRLAALREQVESIEEAIRQKNKQRTGAKQATEDDSVKPLVPAEPAAAVEEADDYYDRTKEAAKARPSKADVRAARFGAKKPVKGILVSAAAKAHTYDTLVAQQTELQQQLSAAMAALTQLDEEEAAAAAAAAAGDGAGAEAADALDSLDAFLLSNEAAARAERRQEVLRDRDRIEAELRQTGALMKLAQPSLPALKPTVSTVTSSLATGFYRVKRDSGGGGGGSGGDGAGKHVKWAETNEEVEVSDEDAPLAHSHVRTVASPIEDPKGDHVAGTSSPTFAKAAAAAKAKVKRKALGPSRPGESAGAGAEEEGGGGGVGGFRRPAKQQKVAAAPVSEDGIGTEETWVPPSGQSGDGRTSLNLKLGY